MAGDLLHFESFEGCRNFALSDVRRSESLSEFVEHVLRQPSPDGKHFCMSLLSCGMVPGQRATETWRCASAPGMSEGRSNYRGVAPRGEPPGA